MPKFQEGDIVRIKNSCSGMIAGEISMVKFYEKDRKLFTFTSLGSTGCSCQTNWELLQTDWDK